MAVLKHLVTHNVLHLTMAFNKKTETSDDMSDVKNIVCLEVQKNLWRGLEAIVAERRGVCVTAGRQAGRTG